MYIFTAKKFEAWTGPNERQANRSRNIVAPQAIMSNQLHCSDCDATFPWYECPNWSWNPEDRCKHNCIPHPTDRTLDLHECPHCGGQAAEVKIDACWRIPAATDPMVRDNDEDQSHWDPVPEPLEAEPLIVPRMMRDVATPAPMVRDIRENWHNVVAAISCWACHPGEGTCHPREATYHQPWCAETPRIRGSECSVCRCLFENGPCVCERFKKEKEESTWMCYHCGELFNGMDRIEKTHTTETCPKNK